MQMMLASLVMVLLVGLLACTGLLVLAGVASCLSPSTHLARRGPDRQTWPWSPPRSRSGSSSCSP